MDKVSPNTIIWTSAILILAILGWIYIHLCKKNNQLIRHKRWIEQIPSIISTLGVLGTFWGITSGLLEFESQDLNNSIPNLLDGLKTAFFTSLAGMIGSLVLSRKVSSDFDKEDEGISDINVAAKEIVRAVTDMSNTTVKTLQELKDQTSIQANNQSAFFIQVSQVLSKLNNDSQNIVSGLNSLILQSQAQTASISDISNDANNIISCLGNMEEADIKLFSIIEETASKIADIHSHTSEMVALNESIASANDDIAQGVRELGTKLHGEVVDIENRMADTNTLLDKKFSEFTELLKKSNTEALVEVMKSVTEEFQIQMNSLISKLVQENFEQLNQSVERLNLWQTENKEMILSLTTQYKEMAENFEDTSIALSDITSHTKLLISDGGKLHELISLLSKVLIEDEHFVEISSNLSQTASLTKESMEYFDESTKKLNEWVKKQRNFVDGVTLLIEKLDELDKIRDYNEAFWKDTKRHLEEGVGYIAQGTQSLNQQLTSLDAVFYKRLSATLAELDTCIQAMIKKQK